MSKIPEELEDWLEENNAKSPVKSAKQQVWESYNKLRNEAHIPKPNEPTALYINRRLKADRLWYATSQYTGFGENI